MYSPTSTKTKMCSVSLRFCHGDSAASSSKPFRMNSHRPVSRASFVWPERQVEHSDELTHSFKRSWSDSQPLDLTVILLPFLSNADESAITKHTSQPNRTVNYLSHLQGVLQVHSSHVLGRYQPPTGSGCSPSTGRSGLLDKSVQGGETRNNYEQQHIVYLFLINQSFQEFEPHHFNWFQIKLFFNMFVAQMLFMLQNTF